MKHEAQLMIEQEFHISKLTKNIKNVIANCISCILGKKAGKQEDFLNPLIKSDPLIKVPLHIFSFGPFGTVEFNQIRN